jgi:copper transport protein
VSTRLRLRGRSLLAALLGALALLVVAAPAASAHAGLVSTSPAQGAVLAGDPPAEATLRFSEAVTTGLGAAKVLSGAGDRADSGSVSTSDGGRVVHVGLRPALADGTYVVVWRVVSADSHPIAGTFTFSIGAPSPVGAASRAAQAGPAVPDGPGRLLGATRLLGFAALLVWVGGALFCLQLWPEGAADRTVRRVLAGAVVVELAAAAVALLAQGPYAAGRGLSALTDGSLLSGVLQTRYGLATGGRVLLCAAAVAVGLRRRERLRAVSTWIGGLVVVGIGLTGGRWTPAVAARVLPRWSLLATGAVGALVLTGVVAALREVRSVGDLAGTAYGRLLVLKVVLVVLMLALGLAGRQWVSRFHGDVPVRGLPRRQVVHAATESVLTSGGVPPVPTEADVAALRRSVRVETVLAAVVLAVTAVLVQTDPGTAASAAAAPAPRTLGGALSGTALPGASEGFQATTKAGPLSVQVFVHPASVGVNALHVLTVGADGQTVDAAELTGALVGPTGDRFTVRPARVGAGVYEDDAVVLPTPGRYTLTLQVRVGEFDVYPVVETLTVG